MESGKPQAIPIVLATDGKFAPYCSVTICSIIENASPVREYHIYVFYDELTDSDIAVLEKIGTDNIRVRCMNVSGYIRPELMYESEAYPRPIYFRLLIPDLLPQYDKVIYLDSDVVVVTDIAELWEIDMGDMVIGAAYDAQHRKQQKEIAAQLEIDARKYFNSGVLLINSPAFAAGRIKAQCYELLSKRKKIMLPDQDALNLACLDKVYYLPVRWNLMTDFGRLPDCVRKREAYHQLYIAALANPGIIHYAGGYKPFRASYLGINSVFWHYAARSPWFRSIFDGWIAYDKKVLFPQELTDMSRDIMETGQCGWRGLFTSFNTALHARLRYLLKRRRKD